jgi:hypothetical protein
VISSPFIICWFHVIVPGGGGDEGLLRQIFEQTKPRKNNITCDTSSISANATRHFKCGEMRHEVMTPRLSSLNGDTTLETLKNIVRAFSDAMMSVPTGQISNSEKPIVQKYMRNIFLPALVGFCRNSHMIEIENERKFQINVEDETSAVTVNGVTDHTLKIRSTDCRVVTIEDKRICLKLSKGCVAQARSEMMIEVDEMFEYFSYEPAQYCGVLQNGCDWIFLFRTATQSHPQWNYVQIPPTFSDNVADDDNCGIVARYLENALVVADRIVDDITNMDKLIVATSLLRVDDEEDDDGSDNDDYDEDNDGNGDGDGDVGHSRRPEVCLGVNMTVTGGHQTSLGSKSACRKRVQLEGGSQINKENTNNTILSLTCANVDRLPISYLKLLGS